MLKIMKLKCKREIPNSSKFTIGNEYEFKQVEGLFGNATFESKDDNGEVWCLPNSVLFEYFTFGFEE